MLIREAKEVMLESERVLRIGGRIFLPYVSDLVIFFLNEAHSSRYSIHLGADKIYHDLSL